MTQQIGDTLLAEVRQRNEQRLALGVVPTLPTGLKNSKLLSALIQSSQCVFANMCGVELEFQEQADLGCAANHYDVSGIITIAGGIRTSIALHLASGLIYASAERLLGIRPEKLDADMLDLVGELTNMVAGGAKERMAMDGLTLGLPTVVAGPAHHVAFGSGMHISAITFGSSEGLLAIDVGFKL